MQEEGDVTGLLLAASGGNREALDRLFPLVYDELRRVARRRLSGERSDHTLATTALVHEAYLKLVNLDRIDWQNRAHFYGVAAQAMRRILIDYAVRRKAEKRGGGRRRVSLDEELVLAEENVGPLLALNEALERLESLDERQARVVEARFFAGLTIEETAVALSISPATVKRDWRMARAWLNKELA